MAAPTPLPDLAQRHLAQARHNYDIYRRLSAAAADADWAITALFYTALHLVKAHAVQAHSLDLTSLIPSTHADYDSYVALRLARALSPYKRLFGAAQRARYRLQPPSAADLRRYHDTDFTRLLEQLAPEGIAL